MERLICKTGDWILNRFTQKPEMGPKKDEIVTTNGDTISELGIIAIYINEYSGYYDKKQFTPISDEELSDYKENDSKKELKPIVKEVEYA